MRGLKAHKGYLNLASDLKILVHAFRRCPAGMELASISAAELRRAEQIAATILTLFGGRKDLRATIEAAADVRQRMFTLFVRLYEEARRAVRAAIEPVRQFSMSLSCNSLDADSPRSERGTNGYVHCKRI